MLNKDLTRYMQSVFRIRQIWGISKKTETTMRWNFIAKAFRFLQTTAEHQDCPIFTGFLIIKNSFQNISTNALTDFALNFANIEAASEDLNLPTIFVVNHWSILKCLLNEVSPVFLTQKNCPVYQNRGFPSTEVTNTDYVNIFPGPIFLCSLKGRVPWIEVSQRKGFAVVWTAKCIKQIMHWVVATRGLKQWKIIKPSVQKVPAVV